MEIKNIYFADEFRTTMRSLQGLTEDDFKKIIPEIKKEILKTKEKDPVKIFENIMEFINKNWNINTNPPFHADWHHFIVPGIILAALKNTEHDIKDTDIEEGIKRGERFSGGSCGFAGTCGGAYGAGITLSILYKTNPLHEDIRSEIMNVVSDILKEIAKYKRRCCKRSSLIAIKMVVNYLKQKGYEKLMLPEKIYCKFSKDNKMCLYKDCLFYKI